MVTINHVPTAAGTQRRQNGRSVGPDCVHFVFLNGPRINDRFGYRGDFQWAKKRLRQSGEEEGEDVNATNKSGIRSDSRREGRSSKVFPRRKDDALQRANDDKPPPTAWQCYWCRGGFFRYVTYENSYSKEKKNSFITLIKRYLNLSRFASCFCFTRR